MYCTWQTVVLIPNGNGEFRGIGIVEVLWKAFSGVTNWRIGVALQFHDMLHGFRAVQGMRNASVKVKLIQQLTEMREEALYKKFLDLRKAYNALIRERCMDILMGYGVRLVNMLTLQCMSRGRSWRFSLP